MQPVEMFQPLSLNSKKRTIEIGLNVSNTRSRLEMRVDLAVVVSARMVTNSTKCPFILKQHIYYTFIRYHWLNDHQLCSHKLHNLIKLLNISFLVVAASYTKCSFAAVIFLLSKQLCVLSICCLHFQNQSLSDLIKRNYICFKSIIWCSLLNVIMFVCIVKRWALAIGRCYGCIMIVLSYTWWLGKFMFERKVHISWWILMLISEYVNSLKLSLYNKIENYNDN